MPIVRVRLYALSFLPLISQCASIASISAIFDVFTDGFARPVSSDCKLSG